MQSISMSKSANSAVILIFLATGLLVSTPVLSLPQLKRASAQRFQAPLSPTFLLAYCRPDFGKYAANSLYETNLKTVISDLKGHASMEMFHNTSAGLSTNTVYGQYYCRGDIDQAFCRDCIKAASQHALNCTNSKAAVIWYAECTLRYKNESMFGVPEEEDVLYLSSKVIKNVTDPATFSVVLNETVTDLIQEAAHGKGAGPVKHFATAEKPVVSMNLTAYFLVQCSPELNGALCQLCLESSFGVMLTCCGEWPAATYTFPPSCQVMYNTFDIFYFPSNSTTSPSPPSSPSSPSPPSKPSSPSPPPPPQVKGSQSPPPSTGGSASIKTIENMKLGIITVTLLLLTLGFKFEY